MSDEGHFHAAFDTAVEDSAARLLFAEWLEERGDERAAGYRWLAERVKSPTAYTLLRGRCWTWEKILPGEEPPDELPMPLSRRINKLAPSASSCTDIDFPPRRDAEEVLCRVLSGH